MNRFCVVIMVLLLTWINATAQKPNDNSPYSRFGLGNQSPQYFASATGYAGLSAAMNDWYSMNINNPASLAFLNSTSLEIGMYGKYANLSTNDNETDVWSGNLQYIALGFPLQNPVNRELERSQKPWRWGMNFAVLPYTNVGYDLESPGTTIQGDSTLNQYVGSGGVYRFVWGNAFRYNNLAVGINASFLFGNIKRNTSTSFDNLENAYNNNITNDYTINGFVWDLGVQYFIDARDEEDKKSLDEEKGIVLGLYGSAGNGYNTKFNRLIVATNQNTNDNDTIVNLIGQKGKGDLPAQITVGAIYKYQNHYQFGFEVGYTNWSNFSNPVEPIELYDNFTFAIGGEYIPDYSSYNKYLKRMRYRIGFRYSTDPRAIDGNLNSTSLTLGIGMPLVSKNSRSYINWGFELGKFGIKDGLEEKFFRLTLGFTLNDNSWFFKRKYN